MHKCLRKLRWTSALCCTGVLLCAWGSSRAEQPARPSAQIPLKSLGFPGYSLSLFHAGASMATLHVLDATHLLFTYSMRSLVPRLPGDNGKNFDRQVAAELVEVPSGKVLARTVWRLHDNGRYLWQVGSGVFVVRMGDDLSLLAPLLNTKAGVDAFERLALPHRPGQPVLVSGSPDGRLITVEVETQAPAAREDEEPREKRRHYVLEFFRLEAGDAPGTPIHLTAAGLVGSPLLLRLAMDGDGYLWAEDGQRDRWMVSFNEFGGKQEKLAPVMSTCHPRLSLLSRAEFLVETCHGSDLAPVLAAYGFDGHENWEEHLSEALQPPTLALAPAAGRFALSRLAASSTGTASSALGGDDPIEQEIRVYQTESGDMLLHVQGTPAVRSAENFDISPDGHTLAVLGPETIDLYTLPELSSRDRKELAEVEQMRPPVGMGPVALTRITRPVSAPAPVAVGDAVHASEEAPPINSSAEGHPAAVRAAISPDRAAAAGTEAAAARRDGEATPVGESVGDASPTETRRRPPTLLGPGEKAEVSGKKSSPQ